MIGMSEGEKELYMYDLANKIVKLTKQVKELSCDLEEWGKRYTELQERVMLEMHKIYKV